MQKTQREGGFANTTLGLKRFSAAYINADRACFGHAQLADILVLGWDWDRSFVNSK